MGGSWYQKVRAWKMSRDVVKLEGITPNFFYFKVNDYDVKYNRRNEVWTCTCKFSSYYNNGKECSHILACRKKANIWDGKYDERN